MQERPELSEGFGAIEVVKSFHEAEALLLRYGVASAAVDGTAVADSEAAPTEDDDEREPGADAFEGNGIVPQNLAERDNGPLPAIFTSWLRDALKQELSGADLESILDGVMVILEGADEDAEAVASAVEVLAGSGAPECAKALPEQWSKAVSC